MLKTFSPCCFVIVVVCSLSLLNAEAVAQANSAPAPVQAPASKIAPPIIPDNLVVNRLASGAELEAPSKTRANEAGRSRTAAFTTLSTGAMYPHLDFEFVPSEAKLAEPSFAAPEEFSEGAPLNFQATAYSLHGRTASGIKTRSGIIAADPRVLPLGTVVQVKAGDYSGTYTVHDTGRRVKGKMIDIWMPSFREARKFGRGPVKVRVLKYGPRRQPIKD